METATETASVDVIQPIATADPAPEAAKEQASATSAKPAGKSLFDDLNAALAPIMEGEPEPAKSEAATETATAGTEKPVDSSEAAKGAEQPKTEEKPAAVDPAPGTKEFNFRELEKRAKAAEEAAKAAAEEKEKAITEREERLTALQKELRAAAIERDPEFVAKYTTAKNRRIEAMAKLVEASPEQIKFAIEAGDDAQLDEWRGVLGGRKAAEWDTALNKVVELDNERAEAVAESEKTWQKLQEERQSQSQQYSQQISQQNLAIAKSVQEKLYAEVPFVANDEELKGTIDQALAEAASGKWDVEKILRTTAFSVAQMKMLGVQSTVIQGLEKEKSDLQKQLAEAQQKLGEQDQFITNRSSATPRGESSSATSNGTGKYVSLLDRLDEAVKPIGYR